MQILSYLYRNVKSKGRQEQQKEEREEEELIRNSAADLLTLEETCSQCDLESVWLGKCRCSRCAMLAYEQIKILRIKATSFYQDNRRPDSENDKLDNLSVVSERVVCRRYSYCHYCLSRT